MSNMSPIQDGDDRMEDSLEELDKVSPSKISTGSVNLKFNGRRGTVGGTPYFGGTFS